MLLFTSYIFICISFYYLPTPAALSVYELDGYLAENGFQATKGNLSFNDCQFTFNEHHGNFSSLGYPEQFPNTYLECDWTIKLMAGRVKMEFKTVDIPMVIHNDRCVAAYMMYGDFNYDGHRVIHGKTCGLNVPTFFVSATPWAWVTLVVTGQGQDLNDVDHKGLLVEFHADITEFTENQLIVASICGLILPACCFVPVLWYYIRKKQLKTRRLHELHDLERVRRKALLNTTMKSVAAQLALQDSTWMKTSPIQMSELLRAGEEGGLRSEIFHLSKPRQSHRWLSSLTSFFRSPQRSSLRREMLQSQESTLAAAAPMHSSDEANEWSADITEGYKSVDSLDSVFIREQPQLLASSTPHPLASAGLGNKLVAQRAIQGNKKKSQQPRPSLESISEADENQQRPTNEGEKDGCLYPDIHKIENHGIESVEEPMFCTPPKARALQIGSDSTVLVSGQAKTKNVTFSMTSPESTCSYSQELRQKVEQLLAANKNHTPEVENCTTINDVKNCTDRSASTWDNAQETMYFECQENKESKTSYGSLSGIKKYSANSDQSIQMATSQSLKMDSTNQISSLMLTASAGLQSFEHTNTARTEMGSVAHSFSELYSDVVSPEGEINSLQKPNFSASSSDHVTPNTDSEKSLTIARKEQPHIGAPVTLPPEIESVDLPRCCSNIYDPVFAVIAKDCSTTSTHSPPALHGIVVRYASITDSSGTNNSSVFKNAYERDSIENPNVQGIFKTPTLDDEEYLSQKCLHSGCRADILDAEIPNNAIETTEINLTDKQHGETDNQDLKTYFDGNQENSQRDQESLENKNKNSTRNQKSGEFIQILPSESEINLVEDKLGSLYSETASTSSKIPKFSQDASSCMAGSLLQEMVEEHSVSCQREMSNTSEELCSDISLSQPMNSSMMSNAFAILAMPSRSPSPIATVYAPLEIDETLQQVSARIKEPKRKSDCISSAWCPPRGNGDGMPQDENRHLCGQATLTEACETQNVKHKYTEELDPDLGEAWSGEGVLLSIKNLSKFAEASCRSHLLQKGKSRERHLSAPSLNLSRTQTSAAREPKRKSDPPRSSWLISTDWSTKFDLGHGSHTTTRDGSRRCLRGTRRMRASCSSAWAPPMNSAQKHLQRTMSLPRRTGRVHFSDNSPEYISDVWSESRRDLEMSDLDGACGGGNEPSKRGFHFSGLLPPSLRDSGLDNSQMNSVSRLYNSSSSMSPKWGGTSIVI